MDTDRNIQNKINDTLNTMESIENVNVSPFFKDKTMQRLFAEKEVEQTGWAWFSPKLQLTTLVCVVVLNIIAFTKLEESSTYDESVSALAESYGLSSSDDDTSLLNN